MVPVKVKWQGNLQQEVTAGAHQFLVDEPRSAGGDDAGPDPYDLLLAALGSCTAMTLLLYARRKDWVITGLEILGTHERLHALACETCESKTGQVDRIELHIRVEGLLIPEQIERLKAVARLCPVRQTLTSETLVEDTFEHVSPRVAQGS